MGRYFRHFPQQERRQNALVLTQEGEPPVRGKRHPSNLPSYYDDVPRSDFRGRSWKRHRATQAHNRRA